MNRDLPNNQSPPAIRLATESDAEQSVAIYAPVVRDTIISFETEPPTADEMRGRVENTLERFPWLVCERHGRVSGYCIPMPETKNPPVVLWKLRCSSPDCSLAVARTGARNQPRPRPERLPDAGNKAKELYTGRFDRT